ncbi:VWA-like domain-containing protein [Rapidithrix thailandica]|uniref:VWA-like domain-containing protein n=1 Tax=Rapidithrix thailandica TaxID=413964 RepID=A0AAW9RUX9_9BACT
MEEISKVCIQLLLHEPFYGHFLMGVPKEFTKRVNTAAVALYRKQMVKLMVNPVFWKSLSQEHQYGLIKHEVLHLVLKHLIRQKGYSNKRLYNIAADLVVNQYIKPEQLPEGGMTLDFFKWVEEECGIELKAEQDVDYYYHQLLKVLHQTSSETGQPGEGRKMLDELLKENLPAFEQHRYWEEFNELTPGELKVLEQQLKNVTKQAALRIRHKGWGNLPAGIIEALENLLLEKPKVDWKRALRLFAASSNSTYLKNTIRRPSKRYGTTPGHKIKRKHELLLAIDTSGSVAIEEFKEFFNEIYHVYRQGAVVTIVECDVNIQKIYPFKGEIPDTVSGRGGTDFNAPIELANEKLRPDAVIYFTDGGAPAPEVKPRMPILWVLSSGKMNSGAHLPGRVIRL